MQTVRNMLSANDTDRIRLAVSEAESRTCGEIVPMIVRASNSYLRLRVTGAITSAITAFVMGVFLTPQSHPSWFLLFEILGYVFGTLLFWIDPFLRLFLSDEEMEAKVRDRAIRAFYEHQLHKTRGATGILMLASLLEHRVYILADQGIHEKVGTEKWQEAVKILTRALKENRVGDGFCEAIAVCGELLATHFPVTGENPNELPDQIILEQGSLEGQ